MAFMTITATIQPNGPSVTAIVMRPGWDEVYSGYPSENKGTSDEYDRDAKSVFKSVLGEKYDEKTFQNACATRVSIALVKSGVKVRKDFLIQDGAGVDEDMKKHAGKGFIASARGLKEWLTERDVWGDPDITIEINNKYNTIEKVAKKLKGRNGVYIILGEGNPNVKDHATLWLGDRSNVIGGRHGITQDGGGVIYFWQLKGRACVSKKVENDQIKDAYWTYGENHVRLSKSREEENITIWNSKKYEDLNLHVVTNEGNDRKMLEFEIEDKNGRTIYLRGIVSNNEAVFKKVFKKCTSI